MSKRSAAFLPDTSCLVAALCSWHQHHGAAAGELGRRLSSGETMILAGHGIAETYAVLTRLPSPHRFSPREAAEILERNFRHRTTVALPADDYWRLVHRARELGVAGGTLYDLIILECACLGAASCLLTFNPRHFERLAPSGLEILVPRQ